MVKTAPAEQLARREEEGKVVELDPFAVDIPDDPEPGIEPDTYTRAGA